MRVLNFCEDDRDVLYRFIGGKKVESDELEVIERYGAIGLVHIGFSFSKKEIQARLTKSGKSLLGVSAEEA